MKQEGKNEQMIVLLPDESTITKCGGCGEKIFYARNELDKLMPLNAKSIKVMTIDPLIHGENQHRIRWIESFQSHFSTCPLR